MGGFGGIILVIIFMLIYVLRNKKIETIKKDQ
jgi:hypothetical protein